MDDDQARQLALEAADRLFYERGVRAVGVDDVRDATGVSLKRLYKLFGTKDQLAEDALNGKADAFRAALRRHVDARDTPRERVLAVFDFLASEVAAPGFRGCAFINAYGEMGATSPGIAAAARAQKQALRDDLRRLVHADGGTPALAHQLALLFDGALVTAAILGRPQAAREAKAAAVALLDA